MLTSGSNKELYGEWEKRRNLAIRDSTNFSATGEQFALDDLEVNEEGSGRYDYLTYQLQNNPLDNGLKSMPKARAVDIRKEPGFD